MIVRAAVALALCLLVVAVGSAQPAASRVIDRTFSCETGFLGGIYQAEVQSSWWIPPQSQRRSPTASVSTNLADGVLGGISPSWLYINQLHCRATKAKLPLTTKGLRGGVFSPLFAEHDCDMPRRMLFRIRGEFLKPTTLRVASPNGFPQLQALGAAKQTELAVGTLAGKPIAYASIAGATKARLFTSSNCKED